MPLPPGLAEWLDANPGRQRQLLDLKRGAFTARGRIESADGRREAEFDSELLSSVTKHVGELPAICHFAFGHPNAAGQRQLPVQAGFGVVAAGGIELGEPDPKFAKQNELRLQCLDFAVVAHQHQHAGRAFVDELQRFAQGTVSVQSCRSTAATNHAEPAGRLHCWHCAPSAQSQRQ